MNVKKYEINERVIKSDFTKYFLYDKGAVVAELTDEEYKKVKLDLVRKYPNAVIQKIVNEDDYKQALNEIRTKKSELEINFMNDLLNENSLDKNEFTIALFNHCHEDCDRNHQYTIDRFSSYAELAKLAIKVYQK